jgi:hypothetical protein
MDSEFATFYPIGYDKTVEEAWKSGFGYTSNKSKMIKIAVVVGLAYFYFTQIR